MIKDSAFYTEYDQFSIFHPLPLRQKFMKTRYLHTKEIINFEFFIPPSSSQFRSFEFDGSKGNDQHFNTPLPSLNSKFDQKLFVLISTSTFFITTNGSRENFNQKIATSLTFPLPKRDHKGRRQYDLLYSGVVLYNI